MAENHWIDDIPVIMISSEDSSSSVKKAYEMGVSDYISRPFDARAVSYTHLDVYKRQSLCHQGDRGYHALCHPPVRGDSGASLCGTGHQPQSKA